MSQSAAAPRPEAPGAGLCLEARIMAVTELCRETLRAQFAELSARLPIECQAPRYWFELLVDHPRNPASLAALRAAERLHPGGGPIGQFALLQAVLATAPRLSGLPLEDSTRHHCCDIFAAIARPLPQWREHFDLAHWRFRELAQMVTMRRFPVGQHEWEVWSLPRCWLLKVHPLALPSVVRELATGVGGFGPMANIHLNAWRANPLMLENETMRSLALVGRSMALRPDLKGMVATSWLYAPALPLISPHLAWLRIFFRDQGALLVDLERAAPDAGFLVGSATRRQLYLRGDFHPRQTLMLWRRANVLAWAARQPV